MAKSDQLKPLIKDNLIPVVSVMLAGAVSWLISNNTVVHKIDEGRSVFVSIGYRYFASIPAYHSGDKVTYKAVLSDIHEDMKWLRSNPYYGRLYKLSDNIHYAQNALVAEIENPSAEGQTLHFMCELYVRDDNESWKDSGNTSAITQDLIKLAKILCEQD